MTIDVIVAEAVAQIDATHAAREQALSASRALTRQCANAIRAAHRGEFDESETLLRAATEIVHDLRQKLNDQPNLLYAG